MPELAADLDDEYASLRDLVASFAADAPQWDRATPAVGWAIRDQISHLAFFDDAARQALVDPGRFADAAQRFMATAAEGDPMEEHLFRGRALDGEALLAWWDDAHRGLVSALDGVDERSRVPWYGPPMGARSFVSARIMETWAHGQDVVDTLSARRPPTDRLRHIAHLGVQSRPYSYAVRNREAPPGLIDVELEAPSKERWRWTVGTVGPAEGLGPASPVASITGPAEAFCLVATQRRNVADTQLVAAGDLATEWLGVVQAFAGPPGTGRPARSA